MRHSGTEVHAGPITLGSMDPNIRRNAHPASSAVIKISCNLAQFCLIVIIKLAQVTERHFNSFTFTIKLLCVSVLFPPRVKLCGGATTGSSSLCAAKPLLQTLTFQKHTAVLMQNKLHLHKPWIRKCCWLMKKCCISHSVSRLSPKSLPLI